MLVEENKPLAPFTTFGIGGAARCFVEGASEHEVAEAVDWARKRGLPLFVLGGGSNLLVADGGFDGLVLKVGLKGICPQYARDGSGQVIYEAGAGAEWDTLVERTVQDGCAGIECLAGIPGTVGGTPVQNVGAYGQEVSTTIERLSAFDINTGKFVVFPASDCAFSYRRSRFNTSDRGRFIVTRVYYRLTSGGAPALAYPDLRREVEKCVPDGREPTLAEVAAAVRQVRQSKGMLLVEGDPDCKSAGSFFKNPVVGEDDLRRIAEAAGKEPPTFSAGEEQVGRVKVPAAWLIENAGFSKGYGRGAAGISSRHTLALINRGGATAAEILALAGEISGAVEAKFGIALEREPVLLGFRTGQGDVGKDLI
jgi:UDP-N-acetylmuramate dehydrogenase